MPGRYLLDTNIAILILNRFVEMTRSELQKKALELPLEERLDLAQALWDSAVPEPEIVLTDEQKALLERRRAAFLAAPNAPTADQLEELSQRDRQYESAKRRALDRLETGFDLGWTPPANRGQLYQVKARAGRPIG